MFQNVGKKIKSYAEKMLTATIVSSIVISLLIAVLLSNFVDGLAAFIIMVILSAVFIVLSYTSIMKLYAYGELVDNVAIIAEYIKDKDNKAEGL